MGEDGQDTHIKQRKTWGGEGEETNTRPPQRWHTCELAQRPWASSSTLRHNKLYYHIDTGPHRPKLPNLFVSPRWRHLLSLWHIFFILRYLYSSFFSYFFVHWVVETSSTRPLMLAFTCWILTWAHLDKLLRGWQDNFRSIWLTFEFHMVNFKENIRVHRTSELK